MGQGKGLRAVAVAAAAIVGSVLAGCSTTSSKQDATAVSLNSDAASANPGGGGTTTTASGPVAPFTDPAAIAACRTEADSIKTAISTWNALFLAGGGTDAFTTPYPKSAAELIAADTQVLDQAPKFYGLEGDGSSPPKIVPLDDRCPAP